MSNVNLKLSEESMDTLFTDLLNDNLETILYIGTEYIHVEDYSYNLTLANSIMALMMYQKDSYEFDKWYADVYAPMLNKYQERYDELTAEERY